MEELLQDYSVKLCDIKCIIRLPHPPYKDKQTIYILNPIMTSCVHKTVYDNENNIELTELYIYYELY